MAIRKYKPTTSRARRGASVSDFRRDHLVINPEKSLGAPAAQQGRPATTPARSPRGHQGRRAQSAAYRVIDFRRHEQGRRPSAGCAHRVRPRTARRAIALLHYADGEEALHPGARGLLKQGGPDRERPERRHQAGQLAAASQTSRSVPSCTRIELRPGGGAKIARFGRRQASSFVAKEGPVRPAPDAVRPKSANVDVPLPRDRRRRSATPSRANINWGKAGRMRWKGKRPTVRGVAMNPVDHPATVVVRAKTSGGRHPVEPERQARGVAPGTTRPSDKDDRSARRRTNKKR